MSTDMKVAIHVVPTITSQGFECTKWKRYVVVEGKNPVGPRGGRGGKWVDGRVISRTFRTRLEAEDYIHLMGLTEVY